MATFKALILITLAGLAFGEVAQPEPFIHSRPYPFFYPSQATAEDAPQLRGNNALNNFLNGLRLPEGVPKTAFQACIATSNLNRESGTVQLLPGLAPRRCLFVIHVPDFNKKVEIHCSKVAVGKEGALQLLPWGDDLTVDGDILKEDLTLIKDYDTYVIRYVDDKSSGSFTCDWRQVIDA